ncbi:MAG: lytic transglycosylase domain-containing protein [Candidatus Eremiobacteraeota bacterium]|nr:lytic transglycosylase domain-containing protein [Candidatus Eremiobacteraeota bacterium]MCW5866458.1 lytic transglycosylase domain-containing protein [Candidatus Eremiobacteraeota bacterium]
MSAQPRSGLTTKKRSGWKVRRPRDGKLSGKRHGFAWFRCICLTLLLAALAAWAWPQPSVQRLRYPLLFREVVLREAERAQLSPSLVAAVILQESEFHPAACSPVGARGLMQLMPETAEWIHQALELRPGKPDLLEPTTNVRLGSTYLNYLRERFDGQEVAVLAAYNAGPQQAQDWLNERPGQRLGISDIPFAETRCYVEAVLQSERRYRELYPELKCGSGHLPI